MDDKDALKWYEAKWEEDFRRWQREKIDLEKRLVEQAEENLQLKKSLSEIENSIALRYQDQLKTCDRNLKEQRAARERCERALQEAKKRLETVSKPALGDDFFDYMSQHLELWDQVLIEEARRIGGTGLEPWLKDIWKERREALSRALAGHAIDWARLRTGLVLEWGLFAWLEGGVEWRNPGSTP